MRKLMSLMIAASGLAMTLPASAATTVLTFPTTSCANLSGPVICGNNSTLSQLYGDQAGLDVSYRSLFLPGDPASPGNGVNQTSLYWYNTGYGDLTGVLYGTAGLTVAEEITFALTTPGNIITLNSLDFAGYNGNRNTSFRIYDLAYNLLYNSGAVVAPGTGHSSLSFNVSNGTGLRLQYGPDGFNTGIDNISFSINPAVNNAVPEPATWAMMLFGFGLVGSILRRRTATRVPASV